MSGSPLLDEKGNLIGIYGRAINNVNTGYNSLLGIPINTANRLLTRNGIDLGESVNSEPTNVSETAPGNSTPIATRDNPAPITIGQRDY
jgi:hypothetical protein